MNNSNQSSPRPSRTVPTKLAIFLLAVALIGFADATYLTIEHYQGVIPPCTLVEGCETVLSSAYSVVGGVPVSLLGAIYYLFVLIGVFSYLESGKMPLFKGALALTVLGFLFSLWFIYVQAFILGAYCLYCLVSALTSTTLFASALVIKKKYLVVA